MKLCMLYLARALALLWAGFWLFFVVAESLAFHTPARAMAPWVGAALLFLILALAPWRWEATGGLLLAIVGLLVGVAYTIWSPAGLPLASRVITTVVLTGPPLVAGILFRMHHRGKSAAASTA